MCTDDQVNIFRVPNYCINDPHFQFELLDNNDSKGEKIEIKLFDVINQKQNKLTVLDSITGNEFLNLSKNKFPYIRIICKKLLVQ